MKAYMFVEFDETPACIGSVTGPGLAAVSGGY